MWSLNSGRDKNLSPIQNVQSSPGAHPASYSIGMRAVSYGWRGEGKVGGTQSW